MSKMQKRMKKIIATLLAAALVFQQIPSNVLAYDSNNHSSTVETSSKEKVYPEYLSAKEAGTGSYKAPHDIKGDGWTALVWNEKTNSWECKAHSTGEQLPPNKHYVVIAPSDGVGSNISYVRCDVFAGEKPGHKYYEVTFKDELNEHTPVKMSVQENNELEPENVPVWGNGYWTFEGGKDEVIPSNVVITKPTTFVWHKRNEPVEETYTVSYWEKDDNTKFPFIMGEYAENFDTIGVDEQYTTRNSNATHDNSGKHMLYGWVTQEGKDDIKKNGSIVINNQTDLNRITAHKGFRSLDTSYDGLTTSGEIKLYAVWANKALIDQVKCRLTINYLEEGTNKELSDAYITDIVFGSEYSVKSPEIPGYVLKNPTETDVVKGVMNVENGITINVYYVETSITINYKSENETMGYVTPKTETVGSATGEVQGSTAIANEGYAFKYWKNADGKIVSYEKNLVPEKVAGIYTACFGKDDNGDETPDDFQAIVTFESVNGVIVEGKEKVYVNLYDELGHLSESETATGNLTQTQIDEAKPTPNVGYNVESITWKDDKVPTTDYVITKDGETFTSIFAKGKYPVKIVFYFDGDPKLKEISQELYGSTFTGAFEKTLTYDGKTYALDKVDNNGLTVSADPKDNIVSVYYGLDENTDIIPDKYQETIVFGVVNGSFLKDDITTTTQVEKVVTLTDTEGNWSEEGTYTLTKEDIPASRPATGYTGEGTWDIQPNGYVVDNVENLQRTFVVTYNDKKLYDVKVEFYFDGVKDDSLTQTSKEPYESIFTGAFEKTLEHNGKTYALDKVDNNGLTVSAKEENVVKVYYATDEKGTDPENPDTGDKVPDKYQVEVNFNAVNGTVTPEKVYVTLFDSEGQWSETGTGHLTDEQVAAIKAVANPGYDQETLVWAPKVPTKDFAITKDGAEFTATFTEASLPLVINYVDEAGNVVAPKYESTVKFNSGFEVKSPVVEGYALLNPEQSVIKGTMDVDGLEFTVVYATDEKGTDPENPDTGDKVPDKYQTTVTFTAVNGTVDVEEVYVTLFDSEGQWSENGIGHLTDEQIQAINPTANEGFSQDTLVWAPKVPTKDIEMNKDGMAFVAVFDEVEVPVVPVDPTDPTDPTTPVDPVVPTNPTTPPTTPVGPTTPVAPTVPAGDAGVVDVEEVEDNETPLADLPEEEINDNETPLAKTEGTWALVNLISTIITVALGLILLISRKKKEEDQDSEEVDANEDPLVKKRGTFTRVVSVIIAILSVIAFLVTEDMTLKMAMVDKWTIMMVVMAVVQVIVFVFGRKWKDQDNENKNEQVAM